MVKNGQNGQKWSKLPKMVKIAKSGQDGRKWSKITQNGPNGRKKGQIGMKIVGLTLRLKLSGPDLTDPTLPT